MCHHLVSAIERHVCYRSGCCLFLLFPIQSSFFVLCRVVPAARGLWRPVRRGRKTLTTSGCQREPFLIQVSQHLQLCVTMMMMDGLTLLAAVTMTLWSLLCREKSESITEKPKGHQEIDWGTIHLVFFFWDIIHDIVPLFNSVPLNRKVNLQFSSIAVPFSPCAPPSEKRSGERSWIS